jgi:transposase
MALSHSRHDAVVWMMAEDQLSCLAGHNGAFERLGGIPAVVRVDNTKTAVSRGAGHWGELNATYRRYALTLRFHVDPCAPYSPEYKGKVERAMCRHSVVRFLFQESRFHRYRAFTRLAPFPG